jgi:putative ABC transport system permease protein
VTALRFFARSWRSALRDPGLRLLTAAVIVAVAALTSVGFFADRVQRALVLQGAALLGADLVVEQGDPVDSGWLEQARQLGLGYRAYRDLSDGHRRRGSAGIGAG